MIPVNRPLILKEDIAAVVESLSQTYISGDTSVIQATENAISSAIGVSETILINSGTTAIDLVIEHLEIKPEDEVVVPTFTIISTVASILRRRGKLKLVDSDPTTWSLDATKTVEMFSERTRAVIPVHIYGLNADMDPIITAARRHGIFILEDAAEAFGSEYKGRKCGSLGDASVFSFYANKVVTGGEGGAICTNNQSLAKFSRSARNLSFQPGLRFVHNSLGYNYRMPSLSASLINSQISRLPELVDAKKNLGKQYLRYLNGHPWLEFAPERNENSENSYWVFGVLLNDECPYNAEQLQKLLLKVDIETRRFFCPIHLQPIFKELNPEYSEKFPVAERLWERGIYLPSGLGNTTDEIEQVCKALWDLTK
jgi:perosamine synthetase